MIGLFCFLLGCVMGATYMWVCFCHYERDKGGSDG